MITEQNICEMAERIRSILPSGATLVSFDRNEQFFGNLALKITLDRVTHTFVTDRGEIYHNGKLLCDSSYHKAGNDDTFLKLLQLIKRELNR